MDNIGEAIRSVTRIANKARPLLEPRRQEIHAVMHTNGDPCVIRACTNSLIVINEIEKMQIETESVCDYLFNHYFKSEYAKEKRALLVLQPGPVVSDKNFFSHRLKSLKVQRENFVRVEKVSIGKLSVQYCLTPTFKDRLNRNLILLHRLEDLIVDLESLYQYAKDKLEEKERVNSELNKVGKTSPYEYKDPREVNFRIPKIKNETEVVTRVRNPTYLDFLYRPQIS
jgi:hypothetical protein